MKRILMALTLSSLMFSSFSFAELDVFDKLSREPSSKAELGLFKIEMIGLGITQKLDGDKIRGTNFRYGKVKTYSTDDAFGLIFQYESSSRNLNFGSCRELMPITTMLMPKNTIFGFFNTKSLDKKEKKQLLDAIKIKTVLVDKNNALLTFPCN